MTTQAKAPIVVIGEFKTIQFDGSMSMGESAKMRAHFMDELVVLRFEVDYQKKQARTKRSKS